MSKHLHHKAVYDPRIVPRAKVFKVNKSAGSYVLDSYSSSNSSNTKLLFNCHMTKNNFLSRYVEVSYSRYITMDVTLGRIATGVGFGLGAGGPPYTTWNPTIEEREAVIVLGRDLALKDFPLMRQAEACSLRIGSEVFSEESDQIQPLVSLLTESDPCNSAPGATCPVSVSKLAINSAQNAGKYNSMLGCSKSQTQEMANGSFWNVTFLDTNNDPISNAEVSSYVDGNGNTIACRYGIPMISGATGNGLTGNVLASYNIRMRVDIRHPIRISPLEFMRRDLGRSQAFYGIDKLTLAIQLSTDLSKSWAFARDGDPQHPRSLTSFGVLNINGSSIQNAVLNVESMSPNTTLPTPELSTFCFYEFDRNQKTQTVTDPGFGGSLTITSNTFNLSQVPEYLVISAKPADNLYDTSNQGLEMNDFYLPITRVRIKYANISEQLNSHTTEALFQMNTRNGLTGIDRNVYQGNAFSGGKDGKRVHLLGSPLVLKLGRDISLPADLASGVSSNSTMTVSVDVIKPYACVKASDPGYHNESSAWTAENAKWLAPAAEVAMNVTSVDLDVVACYMGHLVISADGRTSKEVSPVTREQVINSAFDPSQMSDMDYKLGAGFWSTLRDGFHSAVHYVKPTVEKFGRSLGPVASRVAERYITKKLTGAGGQATTSGGARRSGPKYKMSDIF